MVADNSSSDDDTGLINTGVLRNHIKSAYAPVRQLFEIRKFKTKGKTSYEGVCSLCEDKKVIKMGNNSDINLRSHLHYMHGRSDVLTDGQKVKNDKIKIDEASIPEEKKLIDEAVLECIYEDSRPFGDFIKPGMRKLLKFIKPDYKPMSTQTFGKRNKKK